MILLFLITYFLDFFPNDSFVELNDYNNQLKITSSNNYWIVTSIFKSLVNNGGGAISISQILSKMVIEYSSFINCSSSSNGGAIYSLSTSSIILNCVCGEICKATSNGQFIYINSDKINKIIFTSVIHCYPFPRTGTSACFSVSSPRFENLNCSSIYLSQYSFGGPSYYTSSINFTTVSNCYSDGTDGITISHYMTNAQYFFLTFVNNSQSGTSNGLLHSSYSTVSIFDSIFFSNSYYLFHVVGGGASLTVYNSHMQTNHNAVNGISLKFEISILPIFHSNYCKNITNYFNTPIRTYDENCYQFLFTSKNINSNFFLNTIILRLIL